MFEIAICKIIFSLQKETCEKHVEKLLKYIKYHNYASFCLLLNMFSK